ncbi:MAG: GxxExxY protein [Verrucomicrobia bacterium]|nr:GxxExxY protein [Verrucomicrobiota bacterium]
MGFATLTAREEALATAIVDSAFQVHTTLGPWLLESVYERCFCHELESRAIPFRTQESVLIRYDTLFVENALRLDVIVDDLVICELKAADDFHPVWEAQILSYLKMTEKRLGFILNFNTTRIKDGISRYVL